MNPLALLCFFLRQLLPDVAPARTPACARVARPGFARRRGGFTLVEVSLAIGVVAFAFVGIFALLPAGLGLFRQAMDTSIGAQIAQRVVGELEQTDFDTLVPGSVGSASASVPDPTGYFYLLPYRYFDDEGGEVVYDTASPQDKARILYLVRVRGSMPGAPDPSATDAKNFTSLPSATGSRYHLRNATILTVQVVNNPARLDKTALEAMVDPAAYLILPLTAKQRHLTIQTYSAVVARNGFRSK